MTTRRTAVAAAVGLWVLSTCAWADEDKDESGKGKREYKDEHKHRRREGGSSRNFHGYSRIPNGHLPPPGECRIWYPDRPAGHQPPPFKCNDRRGHVEPGGWLIVPGPQPEEVRVDVYDPRRPGIVVDVGIFDARTGAMVRIVGSK